MKLTKLRKKHPFFYRRATGFGLLFAYLSVLFLSSYDLFAISQSYSVLREIVPIHLWGILFGIAGFGTLFALNFLRSFFARIFIAFGVGLASMWSIGLLVVFLYGLNVGPVAFALFAFVAFHGYNLVTDPLYELKELNTETDRTDGMA